MPKINALSLSKMIRYLQDVGPVSSHDMVDHTGLHDSTVRDYMRAMHAERLIHVAAWEADRLGRDVTPLWAWGAGRDKPRHRFTAAERQARSRAARALREGVFA